MSAAHTTTSLDAASAGHQSPEIAVPGTVVSAVSIIGMIVLSCVLGYWVFLALVKPLGERSATPMSGEGLVLPPAPRLDGIEMMSGEASNGQQIAADHQLQTYGWVDRDKGLIHVPIERAMQFAVERNLLPSATAAKKNATTPNAASGSTTGSKQNTP
jgi:hypothetical protein